MVRHTITIPEQMSEYVTWQVSDGQYAGISDYLRYLIRKDQEQKQASVMALRGLIENAEASGISPRSLDDIWNHGKQKAAQQDV